MTRNVETISPEDKLEKAAKIMEEKKIGSLVVTKNNEIIGIVTESDFLKALAQGLDPLKASVRDVMSKPVVTCPPDMTLKELSALMRNREIKHIPVVESNRLVGIVSSRDLISSLTRELSVLEIFRLLFSR